MNAYLDTSSTRVPVAPAHRHSRRKEAGIVANVAELFGLDAHKSAILDASMPSSMRAGDLLIPSSRLSRHTLCCIGPCRPELSTRGLSSALSVQAALAERVAVVRCVPMPLVYIFSLTSFGYANTGWSRGRSR